MSVDQADQSVSELVQRASNQAAELVRDEIKLAQLELAVTGKKQVEQATPPAPEQALDSVKADMDEIKRRASR